MPLNNPIAIDEDELRELRHDFHRHPELAYEEHRTADRVATLLRGYGVDEVVEGVGKTGVVGILRNGEGGSIGLRADMDALPIHELTNLPYSSRHEGVMHACGHDGHTTMLLAAAKHLAKERPFKGTVVLVFQPAEEGQAGAKAMIDDGLFDRFPVDAIYGVHNMPGVPEGAISVSPGPIMAAADAFKIKVGGQGGHGARPHRCVDPVVAAATMVTSLQSLVSRNVDPHDTLVISVTQIHAGDAFNVIPDAVELAGTVRYFVPAVGEMAQRRMRQVIDGVAAAHGVSAELNYMAGYPPTANHAREAEFARSVAESVNGESQPEQLKVMGSEDFSFFLDERPGAYAWIGAGDQDGQPDLHNPHYDFNDSLLPVGANFFVRLIETALPSHAAE